MVAGARGRGLDVTTEAYPYIAGTTQINSALFNPGWQEKFDMKYSDLMIPSTGERLTKERFEELHASPKPQPIIMFNNTQAMVDQVIANPLTMIASDGVPGHPRNAGTFGRVFAQYVRERRSLTLDGRRSQDVLHAGASAGTQHARSPQEGTRASRRRCRPL